MESAEFERLWVETEPCVRAFLAASCSDRVMVQDLTQEVAMVAWRKRAQFQEGRNFRAWAVGMARLAALRHRRDMARRRVFLAPDVIESLEQTLVVEADTLDRRKAALAVCRDRLGESARRLLTLRFGEDLPLADVAARLGRTHGAVRTAFSRIREGLEKCVGAQLAGSAFNATIEEESCPIQ